jgi:uncharacterized protein (TIGR02246 family)
MRSATIVGVALVLAGCQAKETAEQAQARMATESAAAKTAIEAVNAEFTSHVNQGHASVVAGYYTDDAVFMAPNEPAATGKAAIQTALEGLMTMKPQLTLTTASVTANGPLAVERGTYIMEMTPPGAPGAVSDTGKFLVHWRLVDGKWRLAEDIFNSNLPAAAPPATK